MTDITASGLLRFQRNSWLHSESQTDIVSVADITGLRGLARRVWATARERGSRPPEEDCGVERHLLRTQPLAHAVPRLPPIGIPHQQRRGRVGMPACDPAPNENHREHELERAPC